MPAILGPFESSLRGRNSRDEDEFAKKILHCSCSGASHGSGVKKERHRLERERERRNCSLPPDIHGGACVPDILLDSLQSGERRSSLQGSSRRSSSEVIKRMLYGSATKEDLKNRDVIESMDDESDVTETDTETDTSSVTQEETRRKNLFILKKTTSAGRINFKMRRNSVEDSSERDGSPSPPLNPERPRLTHSSSSKTLPRRTKSSSNTNISSPATLQKSTDRKTSYAFGSSTERFCNKPENDTRSSQDNLSLYPTPTRSTMPTIRRALLLLLTLYHTHSAVTALSPPSSVEGTNARRAFLSRTLAGAGATAVAVLLPSTAIAAAPAAPKVVMQNTENGIKFAVTKEGKGGSFPLKGDIVAIEYTGYLTNGQIFDATHAEGQNKALGFVLGNNAVIPGLNDIVSNMKPGQKVQAIVPPEMAFGDKGICNAENGECLIKPGSTLVYDVKLIRASIPPP